MLHPQANIFGCEPDYDGYNQGRVRGSPPDFGRRRFFGGHIHLDGPFNCPLHIAACFLDVFLADTMSYSSRTSWYGSPGVYRPKPYGIEYRTPGVAWLNGERSRTLVVKRAQSCVEYIRTTSSGVLRKDLNRINWDIVRGRIMGTHTNSMFIRSLPKHIHDAREYLT